MRISVQWMAAAVLALLVGPAAADVYKCEQPDGSVTFSDQKCGNNAEDVEIRDTRSSSSGSRERSAAEQRLLEEYEERRQREADESRRTARAIQEREANRKAIERNQVRIGMTESDVRESWGAPNKINVSVYESGRQEQWVYYRENASNQYVYIEDGRVTGIN